MIMDVIGIKDVSKCWIGIMYAEHYKFLVFIIIMDVTYDVTQDQMLLLMIKVDNAVTGPRIPFII